MPKSHRRKRPAHKPHRLGYPPIDRARLRGQLEVFDPHPGEWTFPLFAARAVTSIVPERFFYEPLPSYESLLAVTLLNGRLLDAAVLPDHAHHLQVVLNVFPSLWSAPKGRLPIPEPDEPCIGQHSVVLTGFDDHGEALLFANTYGPDWGDQGSGVLTRKYADAHLREAWTTRRGRCGLTSRNFDTIITAQARGSALMKAWYAGDDVAAGRYWLGGRQYDYRTYEVVALGSGCLVDVIEARTGGGSDRQGWAHVYYPSDSDIAVVRELFVLPEARRRRIGTALARLAARAARARGCDGLQLDLSEADAFGTSLDAGHAFAVRRGYIWTSEAPGSGVRATGTRSLI